MLSLWEGSAGGQFDLQCCNSVAKSCLTLWDPITAAHQASLSFTISQNLLKLMSIELMMPSNHLILCYPLFLLPSIFPSIRIFSNKLALTIRWPKYGSFSISPSSEYSQLVYLSTDWFGLHVSKGLSRVFSSMIIWKHQFFSAQPSLWSNSHIHTRLLKKMIALTIWTLASKVITLLFNTLSMFVIVFLPRSKCLLIPWL